MSKHDKSPVCGTGVSEQIGNVVKVIRPYKWYDTWVFDDPSCGLKREAFVCGADDLITRISEGIPKREKGFVLIFSEHAIPEATLVVYHHKKGERGVGDYYIHKPTGMVGWLCPALLKYFPKPPKAIYATAKAISPPMVGVGLTNKQIKQRKNQYE